MSWRCIPRTNRRRFEFENRIHKPTSFRRRRESVHRRRKSTSFWRQYDVNSPSIKTVLCEFRGVIAVDLRRRNDVTFRRRIEGNLNSKNVIWQTDFISTAISRRKSISNSQFAVSSSAKCNFVIMSQNEFACTSFCESNSPSKFDVASDFRRRIALVSKNFSHWVMIWFSFVLCCVCGLSYLHETV